MAAKKTSKTVASEERDLTIKRTSVLAPRGNSPTERVLLAEHEFRENPDGSITHLVEGVTRANMPPESWADYVDQVPAAQEAVRDLG